MDVNRLCGCLRLAILGAFLFVLGSTLAHGQNKDLISAAEDGDLTLVKHMLANGANVNAKGANSSTTPNPRQCSVRALAA